MRRELAGSMAFDTSALLEPISMLWHGLKSQGALPAKEAWRADRFTPAATGRVKESTLFAKGELVRIIERGDIEVEACSPKD
jgi:hypothetical protein